MAGGATQSPSYPEQLLHDLKDYMVDFIEKTREEYVFDVDGVQLYPWGAGSQLAPIPALFVDAVANHAPLQTLDYMIRDGAGPPTLTAMSVVKLVASSPPCRAVDGCGCWRCTRMPRVMRDMARAAADAIRVITTTTEDGETILRVASRIHEFDTVKSLLDMGADPNEHNNPRNTTLLHEVMRDREPHDTMEFVLTDTMDLLLRAGADIEAEEAVYGSPICLAVRRHLPRCAKMLMAAGARTCRQNIDGRTALGLAICLGNMDLARVFLQEGADVDLMSKREWEECRIVARQKRARDIWRILAASAHAHK